MTGPRRFFDKLATEYEAQNRYRYQFYRWIMQTILKQIDPDKSEILDRSIALKERGLVGQFSGA